MKYEVWNQGSEVVPGTKLVSFRDEEFEFVACAHPRKILMKDSLGHTHEYYPSVFDVLIEEALNGSD